MATNDQKRHRSITKSLEENLQTPILVTNRMKRKTFLTNSEEILHATAKKLDGVKSIEFEQKDQKLEISPSIDGSSLNRNDQFDRENDFDDDYADRIFNYLGEACTKQTTSSLAPVEIHPINTYTPSILLTTPASDKEIKPFLCTFCPYFARNLHEFQTHIAKHTEKNFRCLLCNCMYKYRRDCVTHMKRKHSTTVAGSISQYIQKIHDPTRSNNSIQPSSSTPNNSNALLELKRYGCPYCSLMTKSTSSIYKHQSRKHASFPKIVHKYSTDDPNTRSLVAILKQKSIKKPNSQAIEDEIPIPDESFNPKDLPVSSSSSFVHQQTESFPLVNRHRCISSKYITALNMRSSNGRISKFFQCCLCGYQASHRSNVVRHVKKIHTIDLHESNLTTNNETPSLSTEHLPSEDNSEQIPNYSFHTTVQAPLILNEIQENDPSNKSYADIHLSINIFLPKKTQPNSFNQITSDWSNSEEQTNDLYSADDLSEDDEDEQTKLHISTSHQQTLSSGSLYKPHKCRRCFYRSNWKTDMLHHIRLKHQINDAKKSDYISMDHHCALRSFSTYEKTFGKVLKNRLLLPKIDYIDCTWEELKLKLSINDDQKKVNRQCSSSPSMEQETISSMNNEDKSLYIDNHQSMF